MSKPDIIVQDRSELGILVHHELDDAGLSPAEFRIYCHLSRRAAKQGRAWPGRESMAETCRLTGRTVTTAIQGLERRQMLVAHRTPGQRSIYVLTKRSSWVVPSLSTGPGKNNTRCHSSLPPGKNNTTKSTKEKETKKSTPTGSFDEVIHQGIYDAYPKKVGRPAALKAIARAIKKGADPARLLELTQKYAAAVKDTDPQFIPHPATWFNQERFNDDPSTWERTSGDKRTRGSSPINASNSNADAAGDY
jgi:hypothetical protein